MSREFAGKAKEKTTLPGTVGPVDGRGCGEDLEKLDTVSETILFAASDGFLQGAVFTGIDPEDCGLVAARKKKSRPAYLMGNLSVCGG